MSRASHLGSGSSRKLDGRSSATLQRELRDAEQIECGRNTRALPRISGTTGYKRGYHADELPPEASC